MDKAKGTCGFIYVATGEKFLREALVSLNSLRRHLPKAKVTLISDASTVSQLDDQQFDEVVVRKPAECESWRSNLTSKIDGITASPYEKTIFLDTDTYICDRVDEIFDLLDYFDVLACHDFYDVTPVKIGSLHLRAFPPLNTGVLAFSRNARVKNLLLKWTQLFTEDRQGYYWSDQPAFYDALVQSNARLNVLHSIYNFRIRQNLGVLDGHRVKILHGRCTEKEFERYSSSLNSGDLSQRAWVACRNLDWNSIRRHCGLWEEAKSWMRSIVRQLLNRRKQKLQMPEDSHTAFFIRPIEAEMIGQDPNSGAASYRSVGCDDMVDK